MNIAPIRCDFNDYPASVLIFKIDLPSIIDQMSNLSVIAEGVESNAQLALLRDHDCVAYQGFLFIKAVPIEGFEKLLVEL